MNHFNQYKEEQLREYSYPQTPRIIPYHEQISMLIDTLHFVLNKVSELCRWKQEENGLKRKKSVIKLFDKNIDHLPQVKMESIEVPVFD